MKKYISLLLMIAGVVLVGLFGYVACGLLASPLILRWTIFPESIAFSLALVFLGLLLFVLGFILYRKVNIRKSSD